jgi:hypothetical protein
MLSVPLRVEERVHFGRGGRGGRKGVEPGPASESLPTGRVPRVARLMALAIRFEGLVRAGVVKDYAELARVGHVTRARVSQLTNLLNLAPDIQEQLLFLPPIRAGRDPICLRDLQPVALSPDWKKQRKSWANLQSRL